MVEPSIAAFPGGDKGQNETPAVSLVSYKEESSDSEQDEDENEYLVPRKRARLAQDKQG